MGLNTKTVSVGVKSQFHEKDIDATISFLNAIKAVGKKKKDELKT